MLPISLFLLSIGGLILVYGVYGYVSSNYADFVKGDNMSNLSRNSNTIFNIKIKFVLIYELEIAFNPRNDE